MGRWRGSREEEVGGWRLAVGEGVEVARWDGVGGEELPGCLYAGPRGLEAVDGVWVGVPPVGGPGGGLVVGVGLPGPLEPPPGLPGLAGGGGAGGGQGGEGGGRGLGRRRVEVALGALQPRAGARRRAGPARVVGERQVRALVQPEAPRVQLSQVLLLLLMGQDLVDEHTAEDGDQDPDDGEAEHGAQVGGHRREVDGEEEAPQHHRQAAAHEAQHRVLLGEARIPGPWGRLGPPGGCPVGRGGVRGGPGGQGQEVGGPRGQLGGGAPQKGGGVRLVLLPSVGGGGGGGEVGAVVKCHKENWRLFGCLFDLEIISLC